MTIVEILERITSLLESKRIAFRLITHEPVFTSAESAAIRGVSLHSGAKALVVKVGEAFRMIVLPADFSLNSKLVKQTMNCKNIRFANREEVQMLTGLTPGAIPPFGSLFELETFCDSRLLENETVYFNAGSHTDSIGLASADYVTVENPILGSFGTPTINEVPT
jgi:Ala-tRNA(Pro) deacylase